MMKRYLLFCQLALLPTLAVQAQFFTGTDGFFIQANTPVFIDSLTLEPSIDLSLTSQTLTVSPDPVTGTPPGIERVYHFTSPFNFSGIAGFYYQGTELNGNTESSLQLYHGDAGFVSTTGSTVDVGAHYISNSLDNVSFAALTAGQENALPVTLVDFYVSRAENRAVLQWQTSLEKRSSYFEVQQSKDTRAWNTLGRVSAAGQSTALVSYSFVDPAIRSGTQYYRLKMVDFDGSFSFSPLRSIGWGAAGLIGVYPNPVQDRLFFDGSVTHFRLTDLSGRSLLEVSNPDRGVDLTGYPAGIYFVKVETESGSSQVLKVLKK